MRQIALIIEYDGTNYCGWQRQLNGNSLQAEIEKSLAHLLTVPTRIYGASRTDAGVHARGQVATFRAMTTIAIEKIPAALNSRLPADIVIRHAYEVDENFSARYSVKMKLYRYTIDNCPQRIALGRDYSWHLPYLLDVEKMRAAAQYFIGTHNFRSFTKKKKDAEKPDDYVREIVACTLTQHEYKIFIDFMGRSFLYNMVRNIVGTLVDVGWGKINAAEIPAIIAAENRPDAGQGAPAGGLCLEWIRY